MTVNVVPAFAPAGHSNNGSQEAAVEGHQLHNGVCRVFEIGGFAVEVCRIQSGTHGCGWRLRLWLCLLVCVANNKGSCFVASGRSVGSGLALTRKQGPRVLSEPRGVLDNTAAGGPNLKVSRGFIIQESS